MKYNIITNIILMAALVAGGFPMPVCAQKQGDASIHFYKPWIKELNCPGNNIKYHQLDTCKVDESEKYILCVMTGKVDGLSNGYIKGIVRENNSRKKMYYSNEDTIKDGRFDNLLLNIEKGKESNIEIQVYDNNNKPYLQTPCGIAIEKDAYVGATETSYSPPVNVVLAEARGIGLMSPRDCTFSAPCFCTRQDSALHIKLTKRGYAAVFTEDNGKYYNGRTVISDATEGDTKLPIGTASLLNRVYKLYIVTSEENLSIFPDSAPFTKLPSGKNGQIYGPIYMVHTGENIQTDSSLDESLDMAKDVKYTGYDRVKFIQYHREGSLVFYRSYGWIDADISGQFDITRLHVLRIEYNAPYACSIYLALKNDSDQDLIQNTRQGGMSKYKIDLPPSKSRQVIDLSDYILPDVMNKRVRFIAFSNPTGDVTITSLKFTKRTEDFSIPVYRP